MAFENVASSPEDSPEAGLVDALAHDFSADEKYVDDLWREKAGEDQDSQAILTFANKLAGGDPAIKFAIIQGHLAVPAIRQRRESQAELEALLDEPRAIQSPLLLVALGEKAVADDKDGSIMDEPEDTPPAA